MEAVRAAGGDGKRMVVRLAGGAQVLDSQGVFQIGKRNYLAARRILWKAGILIAGRGGGRRGIPDHAPGGGPGPSVGSRGRRRRTGTGAE